MPAACWPWPPSTIGRAGLKRLSDRRGHAADRAGLGREVHGPDGLIDRKPPGQPLTLADAHRTSLTPISKQTLSREVWALGYRKLSARPQHHTKSEVEVSV